MPGFTAEASIYRARNYREIQVDGVSDAFEVVAALGGRGLCRNLVSSRIRIWARTGDAERMGGAISYAVFLAGFLPSQSVAS